jgi:outer membrane receptor for ferrienterochelin and colicin
MRHLLLFLISVSILGACTSTENVQTENFERDPDITEIQSHLTILDHLKRVSGLNITERGSEVFVSMRGVHTINSENNVLFVVNGISIGNRYSALENGVDVNDIKDIRVIRGSMGSQLYGSLGANGVVEVTTK